MGNTNSDLGNVSNSPNFGNPNESQNSSYTLFTNGHFWQWNNVSQPYVNKEFYTDGEFKYGHLLVNNKGGVIESFYPGEQEDTTDDSTDEILKVDLNGQFVIPGIQDSHLHASINALERSFADLQDSKSIDDVLQKLSAHYQKNPNSNWIMGAGWNQLLFEKDFGVMPTRYDLDKVFPDKPVFTIRRCMHIVSCNTAAFYKCKLDPKFPETWNISEKEKDQIFMENGIPNGIIVEDAADIFYRTMLEENNSAKGLVRNEFKFLNANGIVGAQTNDFAMDIIYNQLQEENDLAVRVFHTVFFDEFIIWVKKMYKDAYPESPAPKLEQLIEFTQGLDKTTIRTSEKFGPYFKSPSKESLVSSERIKIFTDGTLGGKTAALSVPYLSDPSDPSESPNYGLFRETKLSLYQKIKIIKNCGLRTEIHAIGDDASDVTIDAMISGGMTDIQDRPVLNHCQLLGKEMIDKMYENKIIANIQPSFVPSDIHYLEKYIPATLHSYSYAWKTISSNGIVCSGGSDTPVEHVNPMLAMFDAIYRPHKHYTSQSKLMADAYIKQLNGTLDLNTQPMKLQEIPESPPESFNPKQCLSFPEALRLYTINGAYTANCDSTSHTDVNLGKLEPGYMADFTVIDKDISTESYKSLIEANVMQTWVNGKQVFDLTQTEAFKFIMKE